jgi:predicted aspartyl protease
LNNNILDKRKSHQGNCFTKTYNGLSRVLDSPVELESAIKPSGRMEFKALWDTGASISLIRPEVARALNLIAVSMIKISTPTSKNETSRVYSINVYLPNHVMVSSVMVAEGIPGGCDMLIGMDIIGLGDFAISNYNGKTVYSFRAPSMAEIDFVKHSYFVPVRNENKIGRNEPCPCGSGKKYKNCHGA